MTINNVYMNVITIHFLRLTSPFLLVVAQLFLLIRVFGAGWSANATDATRCWLRSTQYGMPDASFAPLLSCETFTDNEDFNFCTAHTSLSSPSGRPGRTPSLLLKLFSAYRCWTIRFTSSTSACCNCRCWCWCWWSSDGISVLIGATNGTGILANGPTVFSGAIISKLLLRFSAIASSASSRLMTRPTLVIVSAAPDGEAWWCSWSFCQFRTCVSNAIYLIIMVYIRIWHVKY